MGGWPHPSTRGHLLEKVFRFYFPALPHWILGTSHIPGVWNFLVIPPISHCYLFLFVPLFLWISLLFLPLTCPYPPSFLPLPFPTQVSLSPPSCDYFVPPSKWVWSILILAFFLVELNMVYELYCWHSEILRWYLLINEYIPWMSFCVWVTSLRVIFSSSILLPTKFLKSLFLITE